MFCIYNLRILMCMMLLWYNSNLKIILWQTNPRKKRRPDADDSEDNEYGRVNRKELDSKSIDTQREDFPKGKRKARKRRRLALHGRGIKDVREKRKTDLLTDDDVGPSFSNSTEETVSEDDNQGGGAGPVGSEATSSSEEAGTSWLSTVWSNLQGSGRATAWKNGRVKSVILVYIVMYIYGSEILVSLGSNSNLIE